jgi:uncharacterized delta-60 repeat protein
MRCCIRSLVALSLVTAMPPAFANAGWPDPFFGDDGASVVDLGIANAPDDAMVAMATAPDGRIVAVSQSTSIPFHLPVKFEPGVVRLRADGTPDKTFGDNGRIALRRWFVQAGILATPSSVRAGVNAVAVQADGRIVLAGHATTATATGMLVARLMPDGAPDTTFGGGDGIAIVPFDLGGPTTSTANAVVVQPDGRIVIAGGASPDGGDSDIAVARLDADGDIDTTFSGDGRMTVAFDLGGANATDDDVALALALQADGKIIAAGKAQATSDTDSVVVRLNTNGALDPAFGNLATGKTRLWYATGHDDAAVAVAVSELPTRRIVVAGHTRLGNGNADMAIGVLDAGGVADVSFSGDGRTTIAFDLGGPNFDVVNALRIQTNVQQVGGFPLITRKIVVAGTATSAGTPSSWGAMARLTFGGTLDTTFGVGGKSTFAWDVDGDGVANDVTRMTMDDQGAMAIVGGDAMVLRPDGGSDRALVFGRVVVEP